MRTYLVWAALAAVLAGSLALSPKVDATPVPVLRWHSGDHDIYQSSDRNPFSNPHLERIPPGKSLDSVPELGEDPASDPTNPFFLAWLSCLGDLLIR
ncbi:MAG: hypothetical protein KAW17_10410 [Candidatus Eisenbacteria sp.]|nr:hypothetical protein [Candidatus Eisenbacteria bacterium]